MKQVDTLLRVSTIGLILVSASSFFIEKSPARVLVSEDRSVEDGYMVRIEASGETRELRLVPLDSIWSDDALSLSISRNEDGEKMYEYKKIPNDIKVYHDAESGSVLSVNDGKLSGVLDSNYMIKYENDQHFVMKLTENEFDVTDYIETPNNVNKMITHRISKLERQETTKKPIPIPLMIKDYFRQTTSSYRAEITVIVDSILSNQFGNDTDIYDYLTVFWNGVRKRFQTISSPIIDIKLVGAFIIRNSVDEPFITNSLNGTSAYGFYVLGNGSSWIFSKSSVLPARDLIYVQTGRDLIFNDGNSGLAGIAYLQRACINNNGGNRSLDVGLGEDIGAGYVGVHTAAHEVAHLLGSPHDGDTNGGTAACPWSDGYIMSYIGGSVNSLRFSSCSSSKMDTYLNSTKGQCTRSNLAQTTPPGVYTSSNLPGDRITMTEQCKRLTGNSEASVYTGVPQDTHCYDLHCLFPSGGSWWYMQTWMPAADGASCPTSGRCNEGQCL